MANIRNTRTKFHEKIGQGFDIPSEHVESEGDRLIKELFQKQINTETDLQTELSRSKKFQSASKFVPITELSSGETSLKQFLNVNKSAKNVEHLQSLGLEKNEIDLYQDYQKFGDSIFEKSKSIEPSILKSKVDEIISKINCAQALQSNDHQSTESGVSRHDVELGLAVKPESNESKLYRFALTCKSEIKDDRLPSHPINRIKEIEQETFQHLNEPPIPPLSKRRKKFKKFDNESSSIISHNFKESGTECERKKSKWDMKETPKEYSMNKPTHVYTCPPERKYTIKDGDIIQLNSDLKVNSSCKNNTSAGSNTFVGESSCETLISMNHIKTFRMSTEEIKQLPRFQNYEQGEPNKILFLKNLSSDVVLNDLISIFGNFQKQKEPRILYRLMTGKMKGQAFITFYNTERATEALQSTNGYILKGKPIIIQYGKNK